MSFKLPPLPFQLDVFERSKRLAAAAYFLEQGLGKSKITIDVASFLAYEKQIIKAVMVFAPTQTASNWALEEIPKHGWDGLKHEVFRWVTPDIKSVRLVFSALQQTPAPGHLWWFTFNKETLLNERLHTKLREFMRRVPTLLVLDESTFIKTPNIPTTRKAIALGKFAKARRILTGTPQTKDGLDLFSQYRFLDESILGETTKTGFLNRYCQVTNRYFRKGGRLIETPDTIEVTEGFNQKVAPYTFRYKKEEVLPDLPEKQYSIFNVSLTPSERKLYDELKEKMIINLKALGKEGEIQTFNKLALLIRLHQFLSGIAITDKGLQTFESSKFKALTEILDGATGQIIIWASFRKSIEAITDYLNSHKKTVGYLYGGMKASDKDAAQKGFSNGDLQFLVAHPKTAGRGLTFINCSHAIYYENSYSYEDRIQSEDRIHRIGQEASHCLYAELLCGNTVDENIHDALLHKKEINDVLKREDLEKWLL